MVFSNMKEHILKKNYDFQEIITKGKKRQSKNFIVFYKENTTTYRYGISVGKKLGKAHFRNKMKRQIREILRPIKHKNGDYVIVLRASGCLKSYEEKKTELLKLIGKEV